MYENHMNMTHVYYLSSQLDVSQSTPLEFTVANNEVSNAMLQVLCMVQVCKGYHYIQNHFFMHFALSQSTVVLCI